MLRLQTVRVDLLGDLQSVRGGKISVGRSDSQDKTCFLGDKLEQHVLDLRLYVNRLVSHRYLGQARQVDHGDVQHCHTQPLTIYTPNRYVYLSKSHKKFNKAVSMPYY